MKFEAFSRDPCKSINCPHCKGIVEFYHYSGMGDLVPHFYCDTCSNILFREEDHHKVRDREITIELLNELSENLPACPCGGQFSPEASPKCPHCKREIKHQETPLKMLSDPYAIQIKGARLLKPKKPIYKQFVQTENDDNYNPVQGIGCALIFMGIIGTVFGLIALSGLVSVELGFFGIALNDQLGRIYWVLGCCLALVLGVFLLRKNRL
jgi:hypothetical protein